MIISVHLYNFKIYSRKVKTGMISDMKSFTQLSHPAKVLLFLTVIIVVAMGTKENHFNQPARPSVHIRYHRRIPFILQRHRLTDYRGINGPGYNPHYQGGRHLTNRLLIESRRRRQRVPDLTTNYNKVSRRSREKLSPREGRQNYLPMLRRHGNRRYTITPLLRNSHSGGRNQRRRNYAKTAISLPSKNYHDHYRSYSELSRINAMEITLTKPVTSVTPVSKTFTFTAPLGNPPSYQEQRTNVVITSTPTKLHRHFAILNRRRRVHMHSDGLRKEYPYILNKIANQSWNPCFRCPSDHLITVDRGSHCALVSWPSLRPCSRFTSSTTSANIVVTLGPKPGTEVTEGEYFIQLHIQMFGVKLQTCQFRLKVKARECLSLKAPSNGYMMCTSGARWGSVCKFVCRRGYQLIGNYEVTCEGNQHGVQWTGQPPVCRARRCTSLRAPNHGYIMCSHGLLPPRSSCKFSCERNYQLVGCSVLFCDHRSIQWNHLPPECRAQQCPPIWAPDRGFISCSDGTSLGSICKFMCATNFRRVGNSSSKCTKDNEGNIRWMNQPPLCLAVKRTFRAQHQCQRPVSPDHGLAYCDQPTRVGRYPVGTVCQYFCDIGYKIPQELSKNAVIICRYSKWNITKRVICKKIQESPLFCSKPNDPMNGKTVCEKVRQDGKYPMGATCRYLCNPEFEVSESVSNRPVMVCRGSEWKVYKGVSCVSTHCSEPTIPKNGYLECAQYSTDYPQSGISDSKKLKYPREIICQYHCHHGYTIPSIQRNKTVIQCLGPYWNSTVYPECKVMACTSPPQIDHGSFNCIPGKFGELTSGTICNYHCDKGYVTPLSQSKLTTWKCLSNFQWNITDKPTCLRTVPPEPLNCTDQIMVTETGFAEVKKPRFTDANGKDLDVECTLTKPLKLGNHSNVCKSIDTELQTSAKCTYRIQVIALKCEQLPSVEHGFLSCIAGTFGEFTPGAVCTYKCENGFVIPTSQSDMVARICLSSSRWNVTQVPECWKVYPPKPVNCDNQTLVAKLGVVKVTKPRFVAGDGRELNVMCSLEGLLEPGDHVNFCDAFDPELLTGGVCIYTISVKVPVCAPLPRIDHGSLTCIPGEYGELTPGTICSYHCEKEYTIPLSQTEIMTRICEPHLKWNTTKLPMCLKAYYPKPLDCFNQTLITEEAWLQKSRFVAGDGRELDVKCTLKGKLKPGEYINLCESTDPELQTVGFCSYRIIVKVPTCDPPPQPEYGYIECNTTESDKYPIGTICYYSCLSDYIIPTSQSNLHITVCLALLQWNITSFPECKKKLAPYPKEGACKDEIFETNDPSSITLEPPTFVRAQGDTAMVSCSLTTISSYGIYKNLCRATDPELQTSTSCTYKIEVKHLEQGDDALRHRCDPLNAPANGYIQCQTVEKKLLCDIKCKSGFSMPSNFHLLQEGYVECDPLHGLWNFQRIYRIQRLPDCLAGLPHTMIEGSIKFKTDVRDCLDYENLSLLMDVIKKGLLDRNQEICGQIDCNRFIFSCSGGLGGVKPTLETMWTFQAINEPGTATQDRNITALIETVQFDTKAIIVSDPTFKNEFLNFSAILLEETFTDTHFHLVCQERGFVVNITTNRCWECPTGTYEEDNQCKNCPGNHYQDMTGQTKCKSCPRGTISYSGSRSLVDCKVMSVSSDLDLPELVRDQPYIDECTPNPCKNHGTCTNAPKDSYHCHCKRGYKGHLCQYRQLQKQYFCLNGGTLVLKTRYQFLARCLCPPGYSGRRCGNVKGT